MQTPPDHFSMPASNKTWSCTNLQHPNMVSEASASHIPRVTRQLFGQTPGKHTVKCGHSCKQTNSSLIVEAAESASSVSTVQLYGRNQPTSPFKTPPAVWELPQTTQWGQLSQRAREEWHGLWCGPSCNSKICSWEKPVQTSRGASSCSPQLSLPKGRRSFLRLALFSQQCKGNATLLHFRCSPLAWLW